MKYRNRELRRLYEVEVYTGDPEANPVWVKKKTCVAFNQTQAIRVAGGKVANQPKFICFVTWPEKHGDPLLEIKDTGGPTTHRIEPTIPVSDEWDF